MALRLQQMASHRGIAQKGRRRKTRSVPIAASKKSPAPLDPPAMLPVCSALAQLQSNAVFMAGLVAWAMAQLLKLFTTFFATQRWRWKVLFDSGGMPSSHAALVVAVTTSVGIFNGLSSTAFPLALCFSVIVMYDAAGIRRHAGLQAQVLNEMRSADSSESEPELKLKEVLGHTPLQVAMGAVLGVVIAFAYSKKVGAL